MAPHNEQSMEAITGQDFFNNISRDGYPTSKPKAQPWKNVWTGGQNKGAQDGKLVVACALRHDYGMERPSLLNERTLTASRVVWSRRILAVLML